MEKTASKKASTKRKYAKRSSSKEGAKKAPAKRKYTKTSSKWNKGAGKLLSNISARVNSKPTEMFEIIDGPPIVKRMVKHDPMYMKIVATLEQLIPNKRHFLLDKKNRGRVISIVNRDFPNWKVRTSLNPDNKTVSVWRTQ
jgi:hypothetical protein